VWLLGVTEKVCCVATGAGATLEGDVNCWSDMAGVDWLVRDTKILRSEDKRESEQEASERGEVRESNK